MVPDNRTNLFPSPVESRCGRSCFLPDLLGLVNRRTESRLHTVKQMLREDNTTNEGGGSLHYNTKGVGSVARLKFEAQIPEMERIIGNR